MAWSGDEIHANQIGDNGLRLRFPLCQWKWSTMDSTSNGASSHERRGRSGLTSALDEGLKATLYIGRSAKSCHLPFRTLHDLDDVI